MNEFFDESTMQTVEYSTDGPADSGDHFENYRKSIVTTVAYLIGVPDEHLSGDRFDPEEYERLKNNESATVIRCLCKLRTQFFRNYKSIDDARKYSLRALETLTDYLDIPAIRYLRERGIEVNVSNAKTPTVNIAYINQYILDHVEKVRPLIPDWVEFQYIKGLFLMSGGYAGHNGINLKNNQKKVFAAILEASKTYVPQRNFYPYRMYLTWPRAFRESDGNVLYNDSKFLKLLYALNGDQFRANHYVIDARSDTKQEVYTFLDNADNVAVFVDCENVDPYTFGATLLNLDADQLSKIRKIVLYDDVNTSTAWDYMTNIIAIPVEKVDTERVLDAKSLVDVTMTAGVCKEFYQNGVESVILASSDSDFWGLIKQLPGARFLVLGEFYKTSGAIIDKLKEHDIKHCYMTDFAQDCVQGFKSDVLYLGLLERIKRFNEGGEFGTLDVDRLLTELFSDARIPGAESQIQKEKEAFYNKYLKNGLLLKPIEENGVLRLKIELYKK